MIYEKLFKQAGEKPIHAGLIGTGTYGISLLAQARFIPRLEIPVVCDRDPETARQACLRAGISKENTTVCSNTEAILLAMEKGQCAIAENYDLLMDAPLDVIVECTGNPEAGVIYTPVDGDQHGLLIGLASWAEGLGLEVVCGGKARPYDFVYDENTGKVTNGLDLVSLSMEEMKALDQIQSGEAGRVIEGRRKILRELPQIAEADLCESVIAANATGLLPDTRPIPLYLAVGNQLKEDLPAGSILTCDMIEAPKNSRLWELRKQQDQVFKKVI